jgi:hypothetical protein
MYLIVKVVQKACHAPFFYVFTKLLSVSAHRGFYREAVLDQVLVLDVSVEYLPGFGPVQNSASSRAGFRG